MKPNFADSYKITALTIILGTLAAAPTKSQPITPANDGTNTTINQNGNQFNIEGGTRSGANLFHSFDQFNVNSGQTANFVTTPDTSNILGRVTGGNASYINGLIQVIGSNSNLFLMNPAGIMFGPNARLDIPASFSVTTATGIGFDNNNYWFEAMGTNNYANLIGEPSGYKFNVSNPGAIVNEANLTLKPGENLTFVGGKVINTGELSAAGGNITITAVEGGSTLRISQPGHLLSLEVPSATGSDSETGSVNPHSLPELLTGGSDMNATSVTVNESGEVVLTASNTVVEDVAGTAIASGSIDVSSGEDVGGQVNVLGDRVALIDTNINADALDGGGTVLIGGNSEGTVFNSQETSVNSGSTISANTIYFGDGGNVTIWSDGNTNFAGEIDVAGGSFGGRGGLVEVRGQQELTFDSGSTISANAINSGDGGNVRIRSDGNTNFAGEIDAAGGSFGGHGGLVEVRGQQELIFDSGSTISADAINSGDGGTVIVWSDGINNFAGNISAKGGQLSGNGGFVRVSSKQQLIFDGNVNVSADLGNPGTILLDPENLILGGLESNNSLENTLGNIILQADNDITINESIETDSSVELKAGRSININADIDTSVGNGNIDLLGNNDDINGVNRSEGKASINQLDGTTLNAGSGTINIQLGNLGEVGDINLANLTTTGQVLVNANGGNIARVSDSSIINAGSVLFQTFGGGGIGLTDAPLQLNVDNLEAVSGSRGVFFDVGNVNIGGVSEDVNGISATGGELEIKSEGNVTLAENISADGAINIEATGDISATGSGISSNGENVSLFATNISIADEFDETSGDADVKLEATNNITVEDIENDVLEFQPGAGAIEFRADFDRDGIGVVQMLDNEADTIKTNERNLTIAGAEIIFGNISTYGSRHGGEINISSQSGNITTGSIHSSTYESTGNGGEINISSQSGNITTGSIRSSTYSGRNGGNITIQTEGDNITTGSIRSSSYGSGNGGDITISAQSVINIKELYSTSLERNGGVITISSQSGDVNTASINSSSLPLSGNGGDITISTQSGDVNTASINSSGNDNGGNIEISAQNGDIKIEKLDSFSFEDFEAGNGGDVFLKAKTISNSSAEQLVINTFSVGRNFSSKGGNVDITANHLSNIEIFTLSGHALAGDVTIKSQAQGNLELSNLSIITSKQTIQDPFSSTARIRPNDPLGRSGKVSINSFGNITLNNVIIESGTIGDDPAGNVNINGLGNITLNNTNILSTTNAEGKAGNISITTPENINIAGDPDTTNTIDGEIKVTTDNIGNAGEIKIEAQNLTISDGISISASTTGVGDAGAININTTEKFNLQTETSLTTESNSPGKAGDITIDSPIVSIGTGAEISATAREQATNPEAGDITINSNELNISGKLGIFAETQGAAPAGSLILQPYNDNPDLKINFTNQGFISASTTSKGSGGNISIKAPENINIAGDPDTINTIDGEIKVTTDNIGNAGEIKIEAQNLTISDGISISASTTGVGDAGAININTTEKFNLQTETSLTTESNSPGKAGDITIDSPIVSIGTGAEISATAREQATNPEAGDITINSNELNISGELGIFAETEGEAPAGTLALKPYNNSPELDIKFRNQGFISARTTSTGNGGNIDISAPETIEIRGDGKISVETIGTGNAGEININTQNLSLSEGVSISAETDSAGAAGNIEINAPTLTIGNGTSISATALENATNTNTDTETGGNIRIFSNNLNISGELGIFAETEGEAPAGTLALKPYNNSPELDINFSNQGFISARTTSTGNGGNINISAPETIDISGDGKITVETVGSGNAGDVNINTGSLEVTNGTQISASTKGTGNAGSVNITADNIVLDGVSTDGTQRSGAFSVVAPTGEGEAGNVTINTGSLTVSNGALISSDLLGKGKGGSVNITADNIVLDGVLNDLPSAVSSTLRSGAEGEAGNVTINTGSLTVTNGAKISRGDKLVESYV
ncbi:filamentous hemagglutinin N-terminal domain-containing protein [Dapis sp. BLCC M229]|uniref:two-partner secretion domain-containing protein n=1 Tax=Dapis sp. BLCC M229 TaxID=3400188 RepID=UPI003CEFA1D0